MTVGHCKPFKACNAGMLMGNRGFMLALHPVADFLFCPSFAAAIGKCTVVQSISLA
ncbi:hypothetical protein HYPGJ_30176 [Hyphomicrobium sp. GJ21]|nr:hypothetical protein HYPGJ_30176 [Hyphomicrobium sp. GJ21]